MFLLARLIPMQRTLPAHWRMGLNTRSFVWKSTQKPATPEEIYQLYRKPEFLNNMSRILPGPDRIRVTSADIEMEKTIRFPRTVYEALQNAALVNTVTRNICGWIDPETQELRFLTYDQFFAEAKQLSAALRELGAQPKNVVATNLTVSKEYLEAMYGTTSMSMILQPIYPNLDVNSVRNILKQGKPPIYLVDSEAKALAVIAHASELAFIKAIVISKPEPSKDLRRRAKAANIQILSMNEVLKLGEGKAHDLVPPDPSDTFGLVYTSGTTGNPKGVIITHESLLQAYRVTSGLMKPIRRRVGDYTFCFLPTGHIYGIMFELLSLIDGGTAMFWRGNVKTLTNDLKIIRPHNIPMVPRIMNRMFNEVHKSLEKASFFKRALFHYCYRKKRNLMLKGNFRNNTIYDKLAFQQIRDALGGRVSIIVSASASLNPSVLEFFKVTCGCAVIEMYGSTEALLATTTSPFDLTAGHIGAPIPSVEIKLVDVPDLGYFAKDDIGEIYIRSPYLFKGYYNNGMETKQVLKDGWFASGDVARWTKEGKLVMIDRQKDIFKLAQGEYITPEKIEAIYSHVIFMDDIFVDGRSEESFCIAIAVPNKTLFLQWAKDKGFVRGPETTFENLCKDVSVRKACLEELRAVGKNHDLNELQQIRNLYLESVPFTPQNGLVTTTLKIKRPLVRKKYDQIIDELYREGSLVAKQGVL
ncbi:long-chain-fatty-acid--CoA ligase 1-like [Tropilaelaps mercedesae]|uniref:long-chain-fatty-acid--CoA ligase n=1 Tax=Tropilaelaps mercedesae TaxID=418985 RepID=A0A1V9XEF0_9ACAR|nr:long-chain-fatty-acid--CoA ligase 1-like [Tropilaelaps mercedesae]